MSGLIDTRLVIEPGQQVALNSAGLWTIEEGHFEIYIISGVTRRFLSEVTGNGAIAFGSEDSHLIALAPQGGVASFTPYGRDTAADVLLPAFLEDWVQRISRGLASATTVEPDTFPTLLGQSTRMAAGEVARAGQGVQWIVGTAETGFRYLGLVEISGAMLPLTELTWVVAATECSFVTQPTSALVAEGRWLSALASFHRLAGATASAWLRRGAEEEVERIAELERRTQEELLAASTRLTGVFQPHSPIDDSDNLSFAISKVIGRKPEGKYVGTNMVSRCAALGLRPRIVTLAANWWRDDRGNMIAIRQEGRIPVALIPDWLGRYWIHQKGLHPRRLDGAVAETLDPQAVTLAEQLPNRPVGWRDLLSRVGRHTRLETFTVLLAGILAAGLGLVTPIALEQVVDVFIPDGLVGGLLLLGLTLAILQMGSVLTSLCSEVARLRVDGKSSSNLQTGIMDRVLRLPSKFLKAQSSADLGMRILSFEQARRTLSAVVFTSLMSGLFGLSSFGLLIYYSPLGGLAAGVLFAVLIAGAVFTGREQLRANREGEALTANVASLTLQIIQNIATVRAFGAERRLFALWARNTAAIRARVLRSRMALVRFETFAVGYEGFAVAIVFAALGYSALSPGAGGHSAGVYIAFLSAFQGVLGVSNSISHGIISVLGLQPIVERASPILHEAPESSSATIDPGPLTGNVELSHVTFRYGAGGPAILQDVAIRVEKGSMVALVGPSGGGKSTALSMILGFERPETGAVLFDGRELSKLDKTAVRRQIGVVRQSGRLIGGSIYENLIGMHSATLDDAWEAAELAGIADDIHAFPMGMHTMIMDGVSSFSGGQVQRLLIARALVGRPKLLILDEATSALDNKTQSQVTGNIERLGITRLVVAHRLSTVEQASCIYFLREGRIQEVGTHHELMSAGGEFARFARRQVF